MTVASDRIAHFLDARNLPGMSPVELVASYALVLLSPIDMETHAQQESKPCPCLSYEEVESIFLSGEQLTEEQGTSSCSALLGSPRNNSALSK
jgi:hypothetical protein